MTRAGGIELRGLKTSLAPRRAAPQPAPRLERYSFVSYCSVAPHHTEPGTARRLALRVCAQLLLENAGTLRLRVAERGTQRAGEALLLPVLLDALDTEPQVHNIHIFTIANQHCYLILFVFVQAQISTGHCKK